MLVLTRRSGEAIYLGEDIKVTLLRVRSGQVRVAIDAPKDLAIWRNELGGSSRRENKSSGNPKPAGVGASTISVEDG